METIQLERTRKNIEDTFENIIRIYGDVSKILQHADDSMKKIGLKPVGDRGATWETSTAFDEPKSWPYRFWARAWFSDKQPNKAVGVCVHVWSPDLDMKQTLETCGILLPVMNLSILELSQPVSQVDRAAIWNRLWGAGWKHNGFEMKNVVLQRVVHGRFTWGLPETRSATYFVDPLTLNPGVFGKSVAEPMAEMLKGNEDYVATRGDLNVLALQPMS